MHGRRWLDRGHRRPPADSASTLRDEGRNTAGDAPAPSGPSREGPRFLWFRPGDGAMRRWGCLSGSVGAIGRRWSPVARNTLGTLLSLFFLWLAFREVPLDQVLATFGAARFRLVALALALVLTSPLLRAMRWRLLYHPARDGLRIPNLAAILLISQMLNIVVPARSGELARIYFMNHTAGRNPVRTLGTIVIEKWLDVLMLLVLVLLVPFFVTLPPWFQDSRMTLALFAGVFFSTALVLSYGRERLLHLLASLARFFPAGWRQPVRQALETGLQSLDVLRSPRVGLQLQAWSLVIWILSALVNYAVLLALGISLPFAAALFVLVVLQVGVAVPSAPGKLGVFHYLCVLALSVFGIDRTTALGYGVLLYFVVFVPPTVLGALGLWWYAGRGRVGNGRWRLE